MVIENIQRLDRCLVFLDIVLPPIKYSINTSNTSISILSDIGEVRCTEGTDGVKQRHLRDFLQNKGLLVAFIHNVFKHDSCVLVTDDTLYTQWVSYGFTWNRSVEGELFWRRVHDEYKTYCRDLTN